MRIVLLLSTALSFACLIGPAAPALGAAPFGYLGIPSRNQQATITETNQKGALAKMSDSTKKFVSNTTSAFSPKKAPVKKTGTTKVIKAKRPEPPKQGFFKSLFNPEPPPPPRTISEWMSLKQIHP